MAIEGPLEELSIHDVLQLLDLARKTGVLTVRSDRLNDEAIIHFDHGAVLFAVRRRSNRQLGQLLLHAGKITERELQRALEIQHENPSRRLAEVLLEMGSASEEDIHLQLRFQMEETIFEVMGWTQGYFRFDERREIAHQQVGVRVRVESLLMEGARRIDEWTRLESKVPNDEAVPALAPVDERESAPLELHPQEWEVLAEIDGERDVRQLAVAVGKSSFEVARIVFGLVSMGVVEVHERRSRMPERKLYAAVREVESLLTEGEVEEASRRVGELEATYAERAEFALLAGRALLAQGRARAATEAFARAVGLDPLSPEAQYRLGFAAVQTGEFSRAVQAWTTFLRLSPGGPRQHMVEQALTAVGTLTQLLKEDGHE